MTDPLARTFNLYRFGAAHASRSLGWSMVNLLLAWHLHTAVGLTGAETGWILFAFLALGGAATFLAGLALSRRRAGGRSVVRVQLPATIAAAVLLWAQFRVDDTRAVIIAGLSFRIAYSIQDVAQNMLASLLPVDESEAHRYARLRVTLSAVTRCCVVGGFALTAAKGMETMLGLIGLAMIASAMSLCGLVFPPQLVAAPPSRHADRSIPVGLPRLLIRWVIAAALLPTLDRLIIFAPAIDGLPASGAWLLAGFCLGSMMGPLIGRPIDRSILLAMIAGSAVLMVVPMPFLIRGAVGVAGAMIHGIAVSVIGVRLWSATSHTAMSDARCGRSSDGVVFGSVILTIHLASAMGMLLLGPLIEGFEAGRQDAAMAAAALTIAGALMLTSINVDGRRQGAVDGPSAGRRMA